MRKVTLTDMEHKVLTVWFKNFGNGVEYNDPVEDMFIDDFTCQCVEDLSDLSNIPRKQIRGVLSSLSKKDIAFIEPRSDDCDLWWLNMGLFEDKLVNVKMTFKEFADNGLNGGIELKD